MRLSHWIERLGEATNFDAHGAAALAQAQSEHRRDSVYVIPLSETSAGAASIDADRQVSTMRVGVILAIRNSRDARGADAASEIEGARDTVLDALVGWTPPDGWGPAQYAAGRLLRFEGRVLWWQDEFEAEFLRGRGARDD